MNEAQTELVASLKMQLADLDRRLGNARSAVEDGQREVDSLARQRDELASLIRHNEQPKALPA